MKLLLLILFTFTFHISLISQIIDVDSIDVIKKEVLAIPRIQGDASMVYKLFESSRFDTLSSTCKNELAIQYYKWRLNEMKLYILSVENEVLFREKIGSVSIGSLIDGIINFESLTGIESESEHNFIGTYQPTKNDIFRWEKWFQQNKNFLCWDSEYNIIYLRKE